MREPLSPNPYARSRRAGLGRQLLVGAAAMLLVAALAGLGTYTYLALTQPEAPEPPAAETVEESAVRPAPTPPAENESAPTPDVPDAREMPEAAFEIPLPALEDSDAEIRGALVELMGADPIETWLKPERIIANLAVTIDNLPRPALAFEQRPLEAAPGQLVTSGTDDEPVLDEANFDRYTPFVELAADLDADALALLYAHYEPLFDEAYRELGYPEADFDTRLLEVIDHLLMAPAVEGPIRLTRPGVMYEFEDESLESRSAGHKLMIRIGPDNAAVIKRKLRELRAALTAAGRGLDAGP